MTENKICFPCMGIKYLSTRSLILTTEVSIRTAITKEIIMKRNFLLSKELSFLRSNSLVEISRVKHKVFVDALVKIARLNYKIGFIAMFFLPTLIITFSLTPILGSNTVNIFPPGAKPYGLPYSEHIQKYWKWIIHIPAKDSPRNDTSGERCASGQSNLNSSVFYLSANTGGKSERTCVVPAGKGLFIPVMQVEISDKEIPNASVEELAQSAKKDQDSVNSLNLKIDDREYTYDNLTKYRTRTEPFEVIFPNNGIFGIVEGGKSKAVADGFYVITEPLTKGNHTINFKSSLICPDPDCADPNFAMDIKYHIIAK